MTKEDIIKEFRIKFLVEALREEGSSGIFVTERSMKDIAPWLSDALTRYAQYVVVASVPEKEKDSHDYGNRECKDCDMFCCNCELCDCCGWLGISFNACREETLKNAEEILKT